MGAQQSSSQNSGSRGEPAKRCYYEVLGIERQSSEDEIKKAYRRKALELHPDRNYGNVETATAKFAEVSSAYEVLSDPQERAWYDSHRESILRGDSGSTEKDQFEHNVRLTSAGDIVSLMGRFSSSVPFTDAPNGFYGILQQTFANLAREEDAACDWEGLEAVDYPNFGSKEDDYEDTVRPFYRVWINFSTKKTFSWRDAYRASDAPDRATRRLIEKENKRLREEGIREFNDAVRVLVAFVRKRDPRYIPNSQSEDDRQRILREAAAAQAARSRAANQAKFDKQVIPDWAKSQEPEEEEAFSDSEISEVEHIECVVCGKTFKSEKQYETHEKSKKHIKAVQQLKREMQLENEQLNLNEDSAGDGDLPVSEFAKFDVTGAIDGKVEILDVLQNDSIEINTTSSQSGDVEDTADTLLSQNKESPAEDSESDLDNEYASRKEVESRISKLFSEQIDMDSTPVVSDADTSGKVGKAKLKRAKKAAKQEQAAHNSLNLQCTFCKRSFASKTKLHAHIEEEDHAQPLEKPIVKPGKGKNKRR